MSSVPRLLQLRRPALSNEPRAERASRRGAEGEATLERWTARRGVVFLHDRRMPQSRVNLDHVAIGPAGVTVIDANRDRGRIEVERQRLLVGRRDCTPLVDSVLAQADAVRAVLADGPHSAVPVRAVLCFVEGEWPWSGSFEVQGVPVVTPRQATKLCASGE